MGVHKKVLTEQERNLFLDKFNKIIEVFDSEVLSDDEKVHFFLNIYSTTKKFETELKYFFDKCGEYESFYLDRVKLEELYKRVFIYEENDMIDNLKHVIKIENMLNNYEYAEYIINAYITMDNSYIPNFFYNDMSIDDDIFNYCVKIIKIVNPVLYSKYEDRKLENIKKRFNDRVKSLEEIVKGIKTGKLSDGTTFDILQFWKLVPFKYFHGLQMELHEYHNNISKKIPLVPDSSFYRNIRNFLTITLPNDTDTVLEYMNKNNIQSFKYVNLEQIINEQKITISQKRILPNGEAVEFEFGDNDIIKIFKYMKYHKLPSLIQVYNILRERYLNGEDLSVPEFEKQDTYIPLVLDDIKEEQKKNIKILSKKKDNKNVLI